MKRAISFIRLYAYLRCECKWKHRPAIRRAWQGSREPEQL
jgi:hypothetical protein